MKLSRVLAALIFLFLTANFLLSFYSWFPSGIVVRSLVPIPEALLLLWVLLVIAVFVPGPGTNPGTRGRKILALVGAGTIVGVMIGFSLAEALFQWIYARSFVPRMDIPAIRSLLLLYLGDIGSLVGLLTPPAIAVLFLLFIGLGIGLVWASVRLLTRSVDGDPRKRRGAIVSLAVMTVVSVPFFFLAPPPKSLAAHTLVSWTESGRGEFYDIQVAEAPGDAPSEARTADEAEPPAYPVPGIPDRDIYLFTIPAYGYAAHSRPGPAGRGPPCGDRTSPYPG